MRGQGRPKEAKEDVPDVLSEMAGDFRLANGLLSFSKLHFQVPGTEVNLTGTYTLDGNQFEFHGKARIQQTRGRNRGSREGHRNKIRAPFRAGLRA